MSGDFLALFGGSLVEDEEEQRSSGPATEYTLAVVVAVLDRQCLVQLPGGPQVVVRQSVFERFECGVKVPVFADEEDWSFVSPRWNPSPHPGEPPPLTRGTRVQFEVLGYDAAKRGLFGRIGTQEAFAPRDLLPWPAAYHGSDPTQLVGQTVELMVSDPFDAQVEVVSEWWIKRLSHSPTLARLYALRTLAGLVAEVKVRIVAVDEVAEAEFLGSRYVVYPEDFGWRRTAVLKVGETVAARLCVDIYAGEVSLSLRCPRHAEWAEIRRRYPIGTVIQRAEYISITARGLTVSVADAKLVVVGVVPIQRFVPDEAFEGVPLPLRVVGHADDCCALVLDLDLALTARWTASPPRLGQLLALRRGRWSAMDPVTLWDIGRSATTTRPVIAPYEWGYVVGVDSSTHSVVVEPRGPARFGRAESGDAGEVIVFEDRTSAQLAATADLPANDAARSRETHLCQVYFTPEGVERVVGSRDARPGFVFTEAVRREAAHETIHGRITARVKGGMDVEILFDASFPDFNPEAPRESGVMAFLPAAQDDVSHRGSESMIGEVYDFRILKSDRKRNHLVLSRRELLEAERAVRWTEMVSTIRVNDMLPGIVVRIEDYGVFIALSADVDGLLHLSNIPPSNLPLAQRFESGAPIETVVLAVTPDEYRVELALPEVPWMNGSETHRRCPADAVMAGRVESFTGDGLLVTLDDGRPGFVHRRDLTWQLHARRALPPRPSGNAWSIGDRIHTVLVGTDEQSGRLALDVRRLLPNPMEAFGRRYPVGAYVSARVRNPRTGVLVELAPGVVGQVIPSLSPSPLERSLNPADTVRLQIMRFDSRRRLFVVALVSARAPPMEPGALRVGDVLDGHVDGMDDTDLFINLRNAERRGRLTRRSVAEFLGEHEMLGEGTKVVVEVIALREDRLELALRDLGAGEPFVAPATQPRLTPAATRRLADSVYLRDGRVASFYVLAARFAVRRVDLEEIFRSTFGPVVPRWTDSLPLDVAKRLVATLTRRRSVPAPEAVPVNNAPAPAATPIAATIVPISRGAHVASPPGPPESQNAVPAVTTQEVPSAAPSVQTTRDIARDNTKPISSSAQFMRRMLYERGLAVGQADEDEDEDLPDKEIETDSREVVVVVPPRADDSPPRHPPPEPHPAPPTPTQVRPPAPLKARLSAEVTLMSWIHVSDIHFGHGSVSHQWNQQFVVNELLRDVKKVVRSKRVPPPEFLFVTGDVGFSGGGSSPVAGESEYALAEEWIVKMTEALDLDRDHVFIVPGNHDVDRGADRDRRVSVIVKAARDDLRGHRLDDVLEDEKETALLGQRMSRFLEMSRSFGHSARTQCKGGLWWRHHVKIEEGMSVRICGVNTALLSADKEDPDHLRIGRKQLYDLLLPYPEEDEVLLFLGHHPLSGGWLADEEDFRKALDRDSAIYLSGHLHEAEVTQIRGNGGGCVRIAAGAVHAEEQEPDDPPVAHGYNFSALVLMPSGELEVRSWPRLWSTKSPKFVPHADHIDEAKGYAWIGLKRIERAPTASTLGPGVVLGNRYRLQEKLGQGGNGHVFRATDTHAAGRVVAIKVFNPDGVALLKSRREALFAGPTRMSRVEHPAIVRILDTRPGDNTSKPYDFYVMDFVDGANLSTAYRGQPCSEADVIELLKMIGGGLAAAHAGGLIHRDLKPSNVILDSKGMVRIVDFDTVKDLRDPSSYSGKQWVSQLYTAPEVLRGDRGNRAVDARADIYSLAVTGIFLLLGDDPSLDYANRMRELAETLRCSTGLRRVLERAAEHDVRFRYGDVNEMLGQLRKLG